MSPGGTNLRDLAGCAASLLLWGLVCLGLGFAVMFAAAFAWDVVT